MAEEGLDKAPLVYKLPGSDGTLRKVLKSLNALKEAIDAGDPVPSAKWGVSTRMFKQAHSNEPLGVGMNCFSTFFLKNVGEKR